MVIKKSILMTAALGMSVIASNQLFAGVIRGTSGDDLILGTNSNDVIYAWEGHDTVKGNNGGDTIYGGNGKDLLYGGNGWDNIWGQQGWDMIEGGNGNDKMGGGTGRDYCFVVEANDLFVSCDWETDLTYVHWNNAQENTWGDWW